VAAKSRRPADDRYYVEPWSPVYMQGDIFRDVPLQFPWPPDVVLPGEEEGSRVFISGPFETTLAILLTPTCTMAAQGPAAQDGQYAMPARSLAPVRPVEELVDRGAIDPDRQLGNLRGDRLRNYLYLPASEMLEIPESAALIYQPTTLHHEVLDGLRIAQLTGEAYWQFRRSMAFFSAGVRIELEDLGPPPAPQNRTS
jgi:hypothetical protein